MFSNHNRVENGESTLSFPVTELWTFYTIKIYCAKPDGLFTWSGSSFWKSKGPSKLFHLFTSHRPYFAFPIWKTVNVSSLDYGNRNSVSTGTDRVSA